MTLKTKGTAHSNEIIMESGINTEESKDKLNDTQYFNSSASSSLKREKFKKNQIISSEENLY